MPRWRWLGAGMLALTWPGLVLACWNEAAARYQLSPDLLYAIARCESGLRPTVVNRSHRARTGTYDIGLMQVNSSHLGRLGTFGITEQELLEACTNIQVGAWILADQIRRHGFSWEAVGAYNAACTELKGGDCVAARSKYAWCVYRQLPATSAAGTEAPAPSSLTHATRAMPIIATRVGP
ncbi:MAG: lytic transglycosylase domain-containing protein [Acidobacteriota bacterium]